jgi:tetratricopeptide (TPR) repeat protein
VRCQKIEVKINVVSYQISEGMEIMVYAEAGKFLTDGLRELDRGNARTALSYFEEAVQLVRSPEILSNLAYCLAKEKGEFETAVSLCNEAIEDDSANVIHYLNLGRVYLLNGKKAEAIRAFRNGLLYEDNKKIKDELKKLGWRKPPVISFLPREHFLNRCFGSLLHRRRLR